MDRVLDLVVGRALSRSQEELVDEEEDGLLLVLLLRAFVLVVASLKDLTRPLLGLPLALLEEFDLDRDL